MHYLTAIPNFTWTTGCPGLCPWSPSLPACSDGKAHSAERAFALGDPPCSHAVASPSTSQNHNGFHSPLEQKKEKEAWEFNLLHSFMMHFLKIFNGNSVPTVLSKNREVYLYWNWKNNNGSAAAIWLNNSTVWGTFRMHVRGLTLYWSPGVQSCFHHLIPYFNVFYASNHGKGKMSL